MKNKSPIIIAPSLLAADWSNLKEEIIRVENAGADWLHLDVMDGSFVPEITFGAKFVEVVSGCSSLPLDVHLMIDKPEMHVERFIKSGANRITFHIEATNHAHRLAQRITELGAKPGIAVNPGTPVERIKSLVPIVELILVMTVNPGWGGQAFIDSTLKKVEFANSLIREENREITLQVDGGINSETSAKVRAVGANCLVAGTAIFKSKNYLKATSEIRGI